MNCAFSECKNEATRTFSFNGSKGELYLCEECLQLYLQHDISRMEIQKDRFLSK